MNLSSTKGRLCAPSRSSPPSPQAFTSIPQLLGTAVVEASQCYPTLGTALCSTNLPSPRLFLLPGDSLWSMTGCCGNSEAWLPQFHWGNSGVSSQLQSSPEDRLRPLSWLHHSSTFPSANSCFPYTSPGTGVVPQSSPQEICMQISASRSTSREVT